MADRSLNHPAIKGTNQKPPKPRSARLHRRRMVDSASGQTFEDRNPADTREVRRHLPTLEQSRCGCRRRRRQARLCQVAPRFPLLVAPKWSSAPPKSSSSAKKHAATAREMGKVIKETPRRRAGKPIDGPADYNAGERPPPLRPEPCRPNSPTNSPWPSGQPIGVCGHESRLELPHGHLLVENPAAVVCGNTCVIKPAQDTPLSPSTLFSADRRRHPERRHQHRHRLRAPEVGTPLTEHPVVRANLAHRLSASAVIVRRDGRQELQTLLARTRRQESMIVLDDANLDLAIEGGLWAAFGQTPDNAGTATSRIIVQKGVLPPVRRPVFFVRRARKIKVGNGLDESVGVGPGPLTEKPA